MNSEFHSWNACLYIPLKIIVSMHNHSSTRFPYISVNRHCGIYSTSLGTYSQFQTMCMVIPRLGWGQHADVWLARDFEKIIYGHLDDCSVFFQNMESGFYLHHKNVAMCTWQAWNISVYHWVGKCSHVLRFHDSFQLKYVSMSACQHWWSSYWLCSSSISGLLSPFWARWIIIHFTCETLIKATAWGSWFYLSLDPYIWPH